MINALEVYRRLKGEYDKTDQPLRERSSILPFGQYEDGSVGLAWPEILAAPAEGIANFGQYGYGEDAVPYNSRMAFDAAGGAMTGGLGVGLAGGMVDDVARAAPRAMPEPQGLKTNLMEQMAAIQAMLDAGLAPDADKLIPALQRGASEAPMEGAADVFYRGVWKADAPVGANRNQWWASDSPRVAASYTTSGDIGSAPAVYPSRARFANPLEVDAHGNSFTAVPFEGRPRITDDIARIATERGHDGVVFRNILDDADASIPSNVIAALRPGTVYSATTGDLLYSNAPTAAAIPAAMEASDTDPALMEYLKLYGL